MSEEESNVPDRHAPSDDLKQLMHLCRQLERTLRGHDGEPGLVTQVALLQKEMTQLRTLVESHLHEHEEQRRFRGSIVRRVSEGVLIWMLIGVLTLAAIGGSVMLVQHVNERNGTDERDRSHDEAFE